MSVPTRAEAQRLFENWAAIGVMGEVAALLSARADGTLLTRDEWDTLTEEGNEPMCTYCGWSGRGIAKHQLVCKHLSDALTEGER